jgi:gamma-glutamylputrescine oxidase
MLSFWEQTNFLKYDLIVIGGGIVGLSTAIQYKKKEPKASILVLERGLFPTGASTKNAGFACFGSLTEILDDLEILEEGEVLSLVERRYRGLKSIRKAFGDTTLDYHPFGGFELITENELPQLDSMERVNSLLEPIFGAPVFEIFKKELGFGPRVKTVVKNKFEGELNSGSFLNSLWTMCGELGVKILTGANVEKLDLAQKEVWVSLGNKESQITFKGGKIAICTNAFTKSLFPDLDIRPGRGLVFVTETLPFKVPWQGSFHYDKGYVYFRNIDNRLLLGGGRNQDFTAENTTGFGVNPKIKNYLVSIMEEVIFPGYSPNIEMEWSGIMAFGPDKRPIIEKVSEDVVLAVRLGGMGVAIGWDTAGELVKLL